MNFRITPISCSTLLLLFVLSPATRGQVVGVHTYTIIGHNTTPGAATGTSSASGQAWAEDCYWDYYGGGSPLHTLNFNDQDIMSGSITHASGSGTVTSDCATASVNCQSTAQQLPHQITGSSIALASSGGMPGYSEAVESNTGAGMNSDFTIDTPTTPLNDPALGRTAPDVLLLVGNFTASASDSGHGWIGATATGPGFNVAVNNFGVVGNTTFTAVPSLATTVNNLDSPGASGVNGSFSVQVVPGQVIQVTGTSGVVLMNVIQDSGGSTAEFSAAFEVRRFNGDTGGRVNFDTGIHVSTL